MIHLTKPRLLPLCAVVLAAGLAQSGVARCIDEENIENRIGTGVEAVPAETNAARMAGINPAIALPQFQLKKIRALR